MDTIYEAELPEASTSDASAPLFALLLPSKISSSILESSTLVCFLVFQCGVFGAYMRAMDPFSKKNVNTQQVVNTQFQ